MTTKNDPRMHTAEHLLNQTMVRMFGCGRCISAHLNPKKSKCDYSLSRQLDEAERSAVEQQVNDVIEADVQVVEELMPRKEAAACFDLSRLPDDTGETVRIVRIGSYDSCPCIGDHVQSTGQLGRFRITTQDCQNSILRIRFTLNPGP